MIQAEKLPPKTESTRMQMVRMSQASRGDAHTPVERIVEDAWRRIDSLVEEKRDIQNWMSSLKAIEAKGQHEIFKKTRFNASAGREMVLAMKVKNNEERQKRIDRLREVEDEIKSLKAKISVNKDAVHQAKIDRDVVQRERILKALDGIQQTLNLLLVFVQQSAPQP